MRATVKQAGLRCPYFAEPASVKRLRFLLTRAGVLAAEIRASVGGTLPEYLALNPGLPLWAAVALVLEAAGRFTPKEAP